MMNEEVDDDEWFNVRGPSKSSRKRESSQLQDLGELLMALSKEQLERLDLPEAGRGLRPMVDCSGNENILGS